MYDLWGKNVVFYGDSITEIGRFNKIGYAWEDIVKNYYKFSNMYVRGVGGSSVAKMNGVTESFYVNPDGSSGGDELTGELCKAYFCSWKRITSMIPESIKDTIDMIFVMGGTNDMGAGGAEGDFSWVSGSDADTEWKESTYYNGGDFDITTFKGGLASTIMKMQKWCPNAKIVVASMLNGRGLVAGENMTEPVVYNGHTTEDFARWVDETSHYMSVDFVDVYRKCGINPFNRAMYIHDTVHPKTKGTYGDSNEGSDALAAAVIGGLKHIKLN